MNRRRFLTVTAAFACAPHLARAATWQGRALGADVSVTLEGPREETAAALADLPEQLEQVERLFSLYRDESLLSHVNRTGVVRAPVAVRDLVRQADRAHRLTGGLFDPTIQPLWRALAEGRDPAPARKLIGWDRVSLDALGTLRLGAGQQLTFNGIAQGFATDLVSDRLAARGFTRALIHVGEHAALGGPFRLGLADPLQGLLGQRTLTDGAIATSSPGAMSLGNAGHILAPDGRPPLWSTVSIEAPSAAQADALSTAAVFMDRHALAELKQRAGLPRVTLVDAEGNLQSL